MKCIWSKMTDETFELEKSLNPLKVVYQHNKLIDL